MLDFATVSVVEEVPGLNYILFLKKKKYKTSTCT